MKGPKQRKDLRNGKERFIEKCGVISVALPGGFDACFDCHFCLAPGVVVAKLQGY